jgi:type VI secretion system protein ImpH
METADRAPAGALNSLESFARNPRAEGLASAMAAALSAVARSQPLERRPRSLGEVLEYLAHNATRLDLFAALRLIETSAPDKPRLGRSRRAKDEVVRIGQAVSFAFPPGSVAGVEFPEGAGLPRLQQRVLGLFGPNGALPTHLTEYVFERGLHAGDPTFARFADVFHHRVLTLFYRAWAASRPVVGLDRPDDDRFAALVANFCGLGEAALRYRDSVTDLAKFAHVGLLVRHARGPEGLAVLLADYFGVSVRVDPWVGQWMKIPPDQRTRLAPAGGFCLLGSEAVAGDEVWDVQCACRIVLGPLDFERYKDFLPLGESFERLKALTRLYLGEELRVDMRLVLKEGEVPLSWLGNDLHLGWTSWLGARLGGDDATDYEQGLDFEPEAAGAYL